MWSQAGECHCCQQKHVQCRCLRHSWARESENILVASYQRIFQNVKQRNVDVMQQVSRNIIIDHQHTCTHMYSPVYSGTCCTGLEKLHGQDLDTGHSPADMSNQWTPPSPDHTPSYQTTRYLENLSKIFLAQDANVQSGILCRQKHFLHYRAQLGCAWGA